jgi:hypothetical protein
LESRPESLSITARTHQNFAGEQLRANEISGRADASTASEHLAWKRQTKGERSGAEENWHCRKIDLLAYVRTSAKAVPANKLTAGS